MMSYVEEEFNSGVGDVAGINEDGEKIPNNCLEITADSLEQNWLV
jgi:hypothetical protein